MLIIVYSLKIIIWLSTQYRFNWSKFIPSETYKTECSIGGCYQSLPTGNWSLNFDDFEIIRSPLISGPEITRFQWVLFEAPVIPDFGKTQMFWPFHWYSQYWFWLNALNSSTGNVPYVDWKTGWSSKSFVHELLNKAFQLTQSGWFFFQWRLVIFPNK